MARHKNTAPQTIDVPMPAALPSVSAEALVNVERQSIERFKRALEIAGEVKTHFGYQTIGKLALVKILSELRDTKSYKGLPYHDENGNTVQVSTIEQFCAYYVGVPYRTLAEEAQRLELLGEEAYLNAKEIGITRQQLRLISKLPEDKESVVKEALLAKDKDAVIDLLDTVITKHAQEREALQKQVHELSETNEAHEQLLAKKNEKIDDLDRKLRAARKRAKPWNARAFDIAQESTNHAFTALQGLDQLNVMRDVILTEDFGADGEAALPAMAKVYHHAVLEVFKEASRLVAASEEVFAGYVDEPTPLIEMGDVFGAQAGEA